MTSNVMPIIWHVSHLHKPTTPNGPRHEVPSPPFLATEIKNRPTAGFAIGSPEICPLR